MRYLVLFLMLLSSCLGAARDYYVATTGDNATGDGLVGTPYATPNKAYTEIDTGYTIYIDAGTYQETHGTGYLYMNRNIKVTFEPKDAGETVIYAPTNASYCVLANNNVGAETIFNNITFQPTTSTYTVRIYNGVDTGNNNRYVFNGCTIVGTASSGKPAIEITALGPNNSAAIFKDCTITSLDQAVFCSNFFGADGGYIYVDNCNISSAPEDAGQILVQLGIDGGTSMGGLGRVFFTNNTLSFTGGTASHSLLLGWGTENCTVMGNTFSGGDYQVVVKGSGHSISNNTVSGNNTLLLKGSDKCTVTNNSLNGSGETSVVSWGPEDIDLNGDRGFYASAGGTNEYFCAHVFAITDANATNETFTIAGAINSNYFIDGATFQVKGSTANDGQWTLADVTPVSTTTVLEVDGNITDETTDGSVVYYPFITTKPDAVFINGAEATEGTIGSLAEGEWGWGHADGDDLLYANNGLTLRQYDTVYVRHNAGDPDAEASDYFLAYYYAANNEIAQNVIQSTGATYVLYTSTADIQDNHFRNNVYYTSEASFGYIDSAAKATWALMQAELQDSVTYTNRWGAFNDDESVYQNNTSGSVVLTDSDGNKFTVGTENTTLGGPTGAAFKGIYGN